LRKLLILVLLPLLLLGCGPQQPEPGQEYPVATITMEDGSIIKIELYPDIAPNTVHNFIELAEAGFYDGLIFHRVIPGYIIQGGCPRGDGTGGPGYTIRGEFAANGFENELSHQVGVISMARVPDDYDSAGSQFFITVDDADSLDGDYAAFGRVVSGLEVAETISLVEKDEDDKPLEPQRIKTVRIDTFGRSYPPAEKIRR
jgi:peptidyl-prolyl cis-trans isomerase B (cyclophilin B)